ncbi:hypothetical protein [Desmonostoc muscorum]|nr:hypothetical protein [Desmonostoc muscorum]
MKTSKLCLEIGQSRRMWRSQIIEALPQSEMMTAKPFTFNTLIPF